MKCYFELIAINRNPEKDAKNKMSTLMDWYFPLVYSYWLMPKTFIRRILVDNDSLIDFKRQTPFIYDMLFINHKLICSLLLVGGLVLFTLSLRRG